MSHKAPFTQFVQDFYQPSLLVVSTEEAQRLCSKNHLSPSELLRPFVVLDNLNIPIRSAASTIQIKNIRFRVVSSTKARPSPLAAVEAQLATAVNTQAPSLQETLQIYRESMNTADAARESVSGRGTQQWYGVNPKPWFTAYRKTMSDGMRYHDQELFDAPVGIFYIVASTNTDHVSCFEELSSQHHLPEGFARGVYDPKIPRFYILLNDCSASEGKVETDKVMRKMQSSFIPHHCKVFSINSLPTPRGPLANNLWASHITTDYWFPPNSGTTGKSTPSSSAAPSPVSAAASTTTATATTVAPEDRDRSVLGCCMSEDDNKRAHAMCFELITKVVIPSLETKINEINATVTEKRKGIRNAFKSWWRKPKEKEALKSGEALYHHSSIESQIRYLADLYFMLKDYDQAQSLYRLVKEDFKSDKAWLHYGSTNEMIALCLFMIDGAYRGEAEALLDAAYQSYKSQVEEEARNSERGLLAKRFATKSIFLAVDIILSSGVTAANLRTAANLLLKVSSEENALCAAMLLEQAASCFLNITPTPLFRKYGFHLIMAGHLFHKSGQKYNAVRCYAASAGVYRGLEWHHIDDHINFTLGRQLYSLNDAESAIRFFLELIGTGRQAAERQNTFLREFLTIVKSWGSVAGVPSRTQKEIKDLVLPKVIDSSLQINDLENAANALVVSQQISTRHSIVGDFTSLFDKQSTWDNLSKDMSDKVAAARKGKWHVVWEPPFKSKRVVVKMPVATRVAGEPILIDVLIENPLSIKIELQEMQLLGELDSEVADPATSSEASSRALLLRDVTSRVNEKVPSSPPSAPIFDSMRRLSSSTQPINAVTTAASTTSTINKLSSIGEEGDGSADSSKRSSHFAVDPIQVVLMPNSRKIFRLSVTPQCDGVLNIRGICWKLFGEVWGRHEFILRGDPLNDTRDNRSKKARTVDTRLQAKIVSNIPWLGIKFNDLPISLLEGQVVKASVTLHNHGSAPLTNLLVNVSTPALVFGVNDGLNEDPFDVTKYASYSGGDSGSKILAQTHGAHGTLFQLSSILEPHSSITLPVYIRGIGEETQVVNMLFRYETGSKVLASRDVKHTLHFAITPSIHIETFPLASQDEVGTFLLGVGITNVREDNQPVNLRQCSIVSTLWSASPVSPAPAESSVAPGCTSTIFFKFVVKRDTSLESSDISLSQNNDSKRISSFSPVLFSFLRMDNAAELIDADNRREAALKKAAEVANVPYRAEPMPDNVPRHCETAALSFHRQEFHMVVLWGLNSQMEGETFLINGQSNLINVKLRKKIVSQSLLTDGGGLQRSRVNSFLDVSTKPSPSLLVTVLHPRTLEIASSSTMGVAPITVNIQNGGSKPINFIFEIIKQDTKLLPRFYWAGPTKKLFSNVEAGQIITFTLKACFIDQGVFDLNRFKCTIHPTTPSTHSPPIVQIFTSQNLIKVTISNVQGKDVKGVDDVKTIEALSNSLIAAAAAVEEVGEVEKVNTVEDHDGASGAGSSGDEAAPPRRRLSNAEVLDEVLGGEGVGVDRDPTTPDPHKAFTSIILETPQPPPGEETDLSLTHGLDPLEQEMLAAALPSVPLPLPLPLPAVKLEFGELGPGVDLTTL